MQCDTAMTCAQLFHEAKLLSLYNRRLTSLMSKIKQGTPPPHQNHLCQVFTPYNSKYSLREISFSSGLVLSLSMGTCRR